MITIFQEIIDELNQMNSSELLNKDNFKEKIRSAGILFIKDNLSF